MVGIPAQSWGEAGTRRTPASAVLKRSYVKHQVDFPPDTPVFQMVPALLEHLGGTARLTDIIARVKPEHIDLDLVLPVKDSPEQEGGFISPESISSIQQLGATLSFSFLSRAAEA
jgi:hypothetical protein